MLSNVDINILYSTLQLDFKHECNFDIIRQSVAYYMENLGGVELLDAQTLSTCAKITSLLRTRESTNNNRSYVFPVDAPV